ncbi:MAG: C-terminal binding protein [Kouleothrix sp.]|nr:C-terminal binding protein [Kouleothrix sp.]
MPTVYIPDPVDSLMPFAEERAAAEAAGAELVLGDGANPQIRDAEVILTTWIRFPPEAIHALERCRLIVRYGIGVDTIDLAAASACGIVVGNAPTYCMHEVADHTAGLALSLARRIPWLDREVRAGNWASVQQHMWGVRRLSSLTLGIVGLGKIGRLFAQRMAPFGFRMLGYDPFLSDEQIAALGVTPTTLDELLRQADLVSLHVPLTPQTRQLISAERLRLMQPSAAIINTSRGPVIDEAALIDALRENRLFGAALDVLEAEPPAADHPLLALDPQRVILTPHFAASSEQIGPDVHREVSAAVAAVLAGRWPPSVMNPGVVPKQPLTH